MIVSDIITRVRNLAGDINVNQFTDSMMIDWINDAVKEIVIANSLCQKDANSVMVIGTTQYNLPADIFKLHSIIVDGEKVAVSSLQEWEALFAGAGGALVANDSGRTTHCYIWAGKLEVYPKPDLAYALKIRYIYEPSAIVYDAGGGAHNAIVPDIPTSYHSRIVTYCLAQVAFQDEDLNKYQRLLQEFTTGVVDLRSRADQEEDVYPSISVNTRDMGEDYESWGI